MTTHPTHVVVGPARHGVVSFGLRLVEALRQAHYPAPVVRIEDWTVLDGAPGRLANSAGVHLNFTDRLYGSTPSGAAERVTALARQVATAGARTTATLHDVPQQADGGNYRERVHAYRAVCRALHGCATNSEHERSLLSENGIADAADVIVIPLPLLIGRPPIRRPDGGRPSVAVLGFLYPGKGHSEVIAAMAAVRREVEFLAIGECSAGHDDLVASLSESARASGREFTITGYLAEDALCAVLQRVSVPVAHHRHVSASGSLNTWIAAHRRPLVAENRYTLEHAERHPGTVRLYPDTHRGLAAAIEAALDDPDSMWLAAGSASGSTPAHTARRYAEALSRWHD